MYNTQACLCVPGDRLLITSSPVTLPIFCIYNQPVGSLNCVCHVSTGRVHMTNCMHACNKSKSAFIYLLIKHNIIQYMQGIAFRFKYCFSIKYIFKIVVV